MTAAELEALHARARRERPDVDVDAAALGAHVDAAAGDARPDALHAGDLAIAVGCLRGAADALAVFERQLVPELAAALRTIDPSPAFTDEVLQTLRDRLLVGAAPKLAGYAGRGPLGGWLRVAALRLALELRRGTWREVPVEDHLVALPHAARSPEQEVAHAEHVATIKEAIRAAIAAQPSKMRVLLRYYYSDGLGVEQLGQLYRVHASTISRWLAATRDAILEDTRARLARALKLGDDDVESLLGLANSLELSLSTVLRATDPG